MLSRVNPLALAIVVVANFILGAVWYMTLANPWMAAIGKTMDQLPEASPAIYLIPIAACIVNAVLLATVMQLAGENTVAGGVKWAVILWAGLVLPYALVHNVFGGFGGLVLIDGGNQLVSLIITGAVLGWRPVVAPARGRASA